VLDIARRHARQYGGPLAELTDPHPLAIPWWSNIVGTAVLIPLAAMVIAGLMTRTRRRSHWPAAGETDSG